MRAKSGLGSLKFTADLRSVPIGLLPPIRSRVLAYCEPFYSFITSETGSHCIPRLTLNSFCLFVAAGAVST